LIGSSLPTAPSPERIIAEILRQVPDLPIPVPIEELAAAVEITAIHRMATENFEGGLITQPERRDGVILVNGKANRLRQRYTIGHELGHYLIAAHQPGNSGQFACSKSDMNIRKADRDNRSQRMEAEANRFSAGILMPLIKFKADMRSQGGPDLNHVVALAATYDVSKEADGDSLLVLSSGPLRHHLVAEWLGEACLQIPPFPFCRSGDRQVSPAIPYPLATKAVKPLGSRSTEGSGLRPLNVLQQSTSKLCVWQMGGR